MARVINGKESINGWLRDTLTALERGDQDEGEAQLSDLMGDIRRLTKPIPYPTKGSSGRAPGFVGDQFGFDHAALKQIEAGVVKAQSFMRGRDLKSAATAIRQALDEWTR